MKINLLSQPREPLTGLETRVGVKSNSMLSPPGWLVIALVVAAPAPALRGADAGEPGFVSIFNGKTLAGWDGNPKLWSVKEGAIVGQTTADNPLKGNTFLIWTNDLVGDFELRCAFKIEANNDKGFANSGIQYRSTILDSNNWVVGGYQADMEAGPTYTGILYEERMTRGIMAARGEKVVWDKDCQKQVTGSLGKSEDLQAILKPGAWNDYTITAQGNHLQHFINGKQTVDVTDNCESKRAMRGVLALQLHAGQPMTVAFRDLRLRKAAAGDSAAAADLSRMQGVWHVAGMEAKGEAVPAEDVANIVVTVKGNGYAVEGTDVHDTGSFTVDPSKSPHQMDIHPDTGPDGGTTMTAIYELSSEGFRVCYARQGDTRPTSFKTDEEGRLVLITYKRK